MRFGHDPMAGKPQRILQQHPHRERQPLEIVPALPGQHIESVDCGGRAAKIELLPGAEGIGNRGGHVLPSGKLELG